MLPVAFTCPLWWVARWATRVLTSLAVVAALAFGAGPVAAAGPTPGPVPTPSAVPTFVVADPPATSCRHTGAHGAALSAPVVPHEAVEQSSPSVDAPGVLPGNQATIAAGVLPVSAAESDRLPEVDAASSRAPRAPPGR